MSPSPHLLPPSRDSTPKYALFRGGLRVRPTGLASRRSKLTFYPRPHLQSPLFLPVYPSSLIHDRFEYLSLETKYLAAWDGGTGHSASGRYAGVCRDAP